MPALPIIGAVTGIGSLVLGAKGLSQQSKAADQAAQAARDAKVDIPAVTQQAHDQAIRNAYESAALERELNPLAPELRTRSMQAIIDNLSAGDYEKLVASGLYEDFMNTAGGGAAPDIYDTGQAVAVTDAGVAPGFEDYGQGTLTKAAQARAAQELALGGKLDQETANQVMRSSAARAGRFGSTLGLGRDLSARDLGLTSLDLANRRLATAGQFGQAEDAFTAQRMGAKNTYGLNAYQMALARQQQQQQYDMQQRQLAFQRQAQQQQYNLGGRQLDLQRQQQRANLGFGLSALGREDFNRALAAGQFGQSIAQPVTGLDPSAIANLAVGNTNLQANAGQQAAAIRAGQGSGLMGLAGQGLGLAASLYRPQPTTYGTWTPPATTPSYALPYNIGGR